MQITKGILAVLADMRAVIDDFFVHVMVMADNDAIRQNRLNLLSKTRALFFDCR